MKETLRKTGIAKIGDVPWGTHFCQFYQTKEDLIDILVPYFKAGLKNNEFCMWVTSEPLSKTEIKSTLSKEIKNLEDYIKKGQLEILDYSQWYTRPGYFDSDKVLESWIEKEEQALKKGFDGLRLTGNTFWLEKKDWQDFTNYEAVINSRINQYHMLAVCTYCLDKCSATEIIEVVSNHQFALIKKEGEWRLIESSEHKKTQEALRASHERYHTLFENSPISIWEVDSSSMKSFFDNLRDSKVQNFRSYLEKHQEEVKQLAVKLKILDINQESVDVFKVKRKEDIHTQLPQFFIEDSWPIFRACLASLAEGQTKFESEIPIRTMSGDIKILALRLSVPSGYEESLSKLLVSFIDITEQREAEELILASQHCLKLINKYTEMLPLLRELVNYTKKFTGCSAVGIRILDNEGNLFYKALKGFSDEFYNLENSRSIRSRGCMCTNIIMGHIDSSSQYFTDGGSFYVNNSSHYLSVLAEKKEETCHTCNQFGYESIALVPIIHRRNILGLIHLADSRKHMFSQNTVQALEGIAIQLGIAINRIETQAKIKKSERELELRNKIANIFLTTSDEGMYSEVLQALLKAVSSKDGLFGFIAENKSLVLASMTKDIWDECKISDKTIIFPRDKWGGIWGKSLIEKKSFYLNESMTVPKGHIPMKRVLVVPILFKKEAIGVFTLANKATDYDSEDQKLLEIIAEKVAPILNARLQRDKQLKKRVHVEKLLKNLRHQQKTEAGFAGIIGRDPKMLEIFDTIKELADVDVPVMIQGESGTGKELVALAIHNEGFRAHQPFLAVNCGALPEGLLESELFGHVRGAFTGAVRDKKGRFELANHGTIFLDEIGDLCPTLQVKLLRVLQEGAFERVGDEKSIRVNVRVISATNKNIQKEIEEGRFRSDLFYRMCVVPITIPPLRDRRGDIPSLIEHILKNALKEYKRNKVEVSPEAFAALVDYHWPGNVRELQNAIQYALVKCGESFIQVNHLPSTISERHSPRQGPIEKPRKRKLDAEAVKQALKETKGNKIEAARMLGVSRATLYRFLDLKNKRKNFNIS